MNKNKRKIILQYIEEIRLNAPATKEASAE
jgi:hypothetical protein